MEYPLVVSVMPYKARDNTELMLKSLIALLAIVMLYMIISGGMF
ncbi:MAG: hypothetical protein P1P80_04440 [ANME-2 cluster archaeon]|nr:hypothetical protein [ANME-2 cluster archaeon]